MWKIQKHSDTATSVIFFLSGSIRVNQAEELKAFLKAEKRKITLDLKEVDIVDRETVIFLSHCRVDGIELKNCPLYIEQWILKENILKSKTNFSDFSLGG
jgi:hypothetical protein